MRILGWEPGPDAREQRYSILTVAMGEREMERVPEHLADEAFRREVARCRSIAIEEKILISVELRDEHGSTLEKTLLRGLE